MCDELTLEITSQKNTLVCRNSGKRRQESSHEKVLSRQSGLTTILADVERCPAAAAAISRRDASARSFLRFAARRIDQIDFDEKLIERREPQWHLRF